MRRILAGAGLSAAFVVMASVFAPQWGTARSDNVSPIVDPTTLPTPIKDDAADSGSTDPHAGLRSLGSIEGVQHHVRIYATPLGPRFTVVTLADRREVATLLSAEDVARFYPEFDLRDLEFDLTGSEETGPLMLADPVDPLDF